MGVLTRSGWMIGLFLAAGGVATAGPASAAPGDPGGDAVCARATARLVKSTSGPCQASEDRLCTQPQDDAVRMIVDRCTPASVADARARWPQPFARFDAVKNAAQQRRTDRQATRDAAANARLRDALPVAQLVSALDAGDSKQIEAIVASHGPDILLDNGETTWRDELLGCVNTVFIYRRARAQCGTPTWDDAGCLQRLFAEGEWRAQSRSPGTHPQFGEDRHTADAESKVHPSCGFHYTAFDTAIAADVDLVQRFKRRQASFASALRFKQQQWESLNRLARDAASREPEVVRSGISDNVCSLYGQQEQIQKQSELQQKIDRSSGTSDPRARRELATSRIVIDEELSRAKAQYVAAGGARAEARQTSRAYWCGRPKQPAVLDTAQHVQLRSLAGKAVPPATICARAEWRELTAKLSDPMFKTCVTEAVVPGSRPTTVAEPDWTRMHEAQQTGDEFVYALGDGIGDSVMHYVFQYAASGWTLLRTESCSLSGGSRCDELADFAVAPATPLAP